jgi:hypothetical protein
MKLRIVSFNEVLETAKLNPRWEVITEGKNYFTVEDQDGYRAYFEVEHYGGDIEKVEYYRRFKFATVHAPNRKTGTGWQYADVSPMAEVNDVLKLITRTLERSRSNIESGRERMDTRKPHENRHYLI